MTPFPSICTHITLQGIPYGKYRRKIIMYLVMVVVIIFVGSVFYMYNEEWTFVDALYFSFIATMVSESVSQPVSQPVSQ